MEILPDRFVFPRNFRFFNRLPARFEILVVSRGATTPRGTVYELEVAGQRLALPSKAELKVGMRYELEKISASEFRILREGNEAQKNIAEAPAQTQRAVQRESAVTVFSTNPAAQPADLIAVKLIADDNVVVAVGADKYAFDLGGDFSLRGVFVPRSPGNYTLFLTGAAADKLATDAFRLSLRDFGVEAVRHVSAEILDRISKGSIDMKT